MKKNLSLLLTLVLLIFLCSCSWGNESVEFHYVRSSYVYGSSDGVIDSESRDVSGREGDLRYLLSLYLRGPLDSQLRAPFPSGCYLQDITKEGDTLRITLDPTFSTLENPELTLACACIAKTCFSLADVTQVQILAAAPEDTASVDITLSADSLLLEDDTPLSQQTTEESQ